MAQLFDITDFGARPGEKCTEAIQAAVNAADAARGTVVVPAGTFVTGTVDLRGASLCLEKGAVLRGSGDLADYREFGYTHNEMHKTLSLLYSVGHSRIRVFGEGTIDLGGSAFFDFSRRNVPESFPPLTEEQRAECTVFIAPRPTQPIFFLRCDHVTMEDITVLDASCWTISFNDCEDIRLTDMTIRTSPVVPNNDGVHFCGCRRVFVRGCDISSGDDCIALSGITDWDIPCEDVTISDCRLTCSSKAIVIGYMHSIVRNVVVSNCVLRDTHRGLCIMSSTRTGLVEHVLVENLVVDTRAHAGNWWGNGEPIAIFALWHNNADCERPIPERDWPVNIRDVMIRGVSCAGENVVAVIGERGSVENVSIDGLHYRRKAAKNVLLKGAGVVDVAPAAERVVAPEGVWLLVQGCRDVRVANAHAVDEEGRPLAEAILP